MGPEGWRGPNLEKVGSPKGGAPKGRAQNFALFSLSRQLSFFLPSLGRSSRGILVVFEASGPGKGMSWTVGITVAVSDAKHRAAEECLLLQRGDHSVWKSFSLDHCTEAAQAGKRA